MTEPIEVNIREIMKALADTRRAVEELTEEKREIAAEIEASFLGERLAKTEEQIKVLRSQAATLENVARDTAMRGFAETGSKKPFVGVAIKEFITLQYDPVAALVWARSNAPEVLVLDAKAFEKTAVVRGAPVTVVKEPRAQIDRDLSGYLADA